MLPNDRSLSLVRLCTVVVLAHVLSSAMARAQCSVTWQQATLPSTTGPVYAATVWDDGSGGGPKLYLGGEIDFINVIDRFQVLRWDTDHFTPFGGSFHHSSGYASVNAFCVFNGELVAGGDFTFVDGVSCSRIAHWNGTAWQPFSFGLADEVHALAVYNGQLVAAGEVNARVQVWDGATWQMLGNNISSGPVNALAVYNGQLIAGGWASPNGICYLDGSTWKPLGGGVDGFVDALTIYNNELIVGGWFSHAGGVAASGIARWNGTSWAPLGSGVAGSYAWVRSFANDGSNLIVGGTFTQAGGLNSNCVAGWNGSTWFSLGGGVDTKNNGEAVARALAVWNGMLVAGGDFYAFHIPPTFESSYWALGTSSCGGCTDNSQCDDGQFCNGVEVCSNGTCMPGVSPCSAPLKCRESDDQCVQCLSDADCSDGLFCNGAEVCNAAGQCQAGTPPCSGSLCRESDDRRVQCLSNADCSDGLFCNGVESCNASGMCQAGTPPCGPGQTCNEAQDSCIGSPQIWMTFAKSTTVPGVGAVADEDIVAYNVVTGTWSMIFDGSDVGLSGLTIGGMTRMSDGSILLSFTASGQIPGLTGGPNGTAVEVSDIVRFVPTSPGTNTAGSFVFYFDGSDVGLTNSSEAIDAIALTPAGQLVMSTVGAVSANGASSADTDLLLFNATSLGSVTTGTFSVYFDGSDVGLTDNGNEDIDGVDILPTGQVLISTLGSFSVPGVSGTGKDIVRFTPTQLGSTTSGIYAPYLDLSTIGIPASANLKGIKLVQ